jgi:hypothetical protein
MKILLFAGLASLVLMTGCASPRPHPISPSPDEVRSALMQSSADRKVSALQELHDAAWPADRQLSLQTLITYYSLEIVPRSGHERQMFIDEAGKLKAMTSELPIHKIPEDTGALIYLADRNKQVPLTTGTMVAIDNFCSADASISARSGSLRKQAEAAARESLAVSCTHYVRGDLEASTVALADALRWQLSAGESIFPQDVKPSFLGGWDVFKARLEDKTGVNLNASEVRLLNH